MPRPDLSMSPAEIDDFLRGPHSGVLSTIGPGGYPHSVGIYYDGGADEVRMWVYGKSQKVRNAEREGKCSLLVEAGEPYVDLKGVLLRGDAHVERDFESVYELGRRMYERYFFPRTGVPFDDGPDERVRHQSKKRVCLVLTPKRIASWDHAKEHSSTGGP